MTIITQVTDCVAQPSAVCQVKRSVPRRSACMRTHSSTVLVYCVLGYLLRQTCNQLNGCSIFLVWGEHSCEDKLFVLGGETSGCLLLLGQLGKVGSTEPANGLSAIVPRKVLGWIRGRRAHIASLALCAECAARHGFACRQLQSGAIA